MRFDGRVAVVTGAGRGIGRAYARLLAELGASVVVNDLGGSPEGHGADAGPATDVVAEITGEGGSAAPDTNDIASPVGAQALIDATVERFGRIDVLVNNAGIMRWARFPHVSDDDFGRHLAVHLVGSFLTARAAWPHLADQGYGRIVMTTSAGVFGMSSNASYATAKGGVIGLTRSLAAAGRSCGINVNLIAPAAVTRLGGAGGDTGPGPGMDPALAAPMVGYLAHETCSANGEMFAAGAGRFARWFLASTPGYVHASGMPTIDDVAAHWAEINDETGAYQPANLQDWSSSFLAHLPESD